MLMDVVIDLRKEFTRGDVRLGKDVFDRLVELFHFRRGAQLHRIVGVNLLNRLNFLARLFGAF